MQIFKTLIRTTISRLATYSFRLIIIGRENIPLDGHCVVVANHNCMGDFLILDRVFRSRLNFLADQDLYNHWYFPLIVWIFQAVTIKSGREVSAIRRCIESIQSGIPVVVFPEGRLVDDARMDEWKEGAGLIAKYAHAHILPVAIIGARTLWPSSTYVPKKGVIRIEIFPCIEARQRRGLDALANAYARISEALVDQ